MECCNFHLDSIYSCPLLDSKDNSIFVWVTKVLKRKNKKIEVDAARQDYVFLSMLPFFKKALFLLLHSRKIPENSFKKHKVIFQINKSSLFLKQTNHQTIFQLLKNTLQPNINWDVTFTKNIFQNFLTELCDIFSRRVVTGIGIKVSVTTVEAFHNDEIKIQQIFSSDWM